MRSELVSKSKFVSLVLRHKPEEIGLTLDENGWASVSELLQKAKMDLPTLEEIVATNEKKRFAFNDDKTKIRASQGHSIDVDLQLKPVDPPKVLYHGTGIRFLDTIMKNGLKKMTRQYVHLSASYETAYKVGSRHGKSVVLIIDCEEMCHNYDHEFFLSENGVWLTDNVPPRFIMAQYSEDTTSLINTAKRAFAALTPDQRAELIGQKYCRHCWRNDTGGCLCQCSNDD